MNSKNTLALLDTEEIRKLFADLYGEQEDIINKNIDRYKTVLENYINKFNDGDIELFSSPGRTEIGGNHTDHNYGKVLTASINLDCVCVAGKTNNNIINIYSVPYNETISVDVEEIEKIKGENGSIALIQGIIAGFKRFGFKVGGFNAYVTSNVISAAGVSSSASFEMLVCSIINTFFNNGEIDKVTYARIGQFAENFYWNKQSGLLDQMACAVGGMIAIDFKDTKKPVFKKVDFSSFNEKYSIMIVNTGKNHADLSEEYSSIPFEMKSVAEHFGEEVCRNISLPQILNNLAELRDVVGDRAILRAMHYLEENERVDGQVKALDEGNFEVFLELINQSGNSSWKWLQNCYSVSNQREQGIPIALALTEMFIKRNGRGACRVHGGGFAGVIMALIPRELTNEYNSYIEKCLGEDTVFEMIIRKYGAVHINGLLEK